jgi:hypothetical protein
VITAKRCPVLDSFSERTGSLSAELENGTSCSGHRVGEPKESYSTGLIPGVKGVLGVMGVSVASSDLPPVPGLGASRNDPLPSVASRDSASSSIVKVRSCSALLFVAAYIRGAPTGQYMAAQCQLMTSFVWSHARNMAQQWCSKCAWEVYGFKSILTPVNSVRGKTRLRWPWAKLTLRKRQQASGWAPQARAFLKMQAPSFLQDFLEVHTTLCHITLRIYRGGPYKGGHALLANFLKPYRKWYITQLLLVALPEGLAF